MEKIIEKLNELKGMFEELKSVYHKKGEEEFDTTRDLLNRIIDRTYPEKDAKDLKDKLIHKSWVISSSTIEDDAYWQKFYLEKIDLSIRVINTILQEYELFGFDDFKPLKEKTETEWQVGSDKFGYIKKKKTR